jgi:hypothetical protein
MSGHGLQRADVRPRSSATSLVPAVGAVAIFLGDGPATLGTGFTGDRHVLGRKPPAAAPGADTDTAYGSKPWQTGPPCRARRPVLGWLSLRLLLGRLGLLVNRALCKLGQLFIRLFIFVERRI